MSISHSNNTVLDLRKEENLSLGLIYLCLTVVPKTEQQTKLATMEWVIRLHMLKLYTSVPHVNCSWF